METIGIGSDHAGFKLKTFIKGELEKRGFKVNDHGTYSEDRADYPDFAHKVSESVENKKDNFGILICGSGNGINMAANRHKGIRSALCWNSEVAELARQHNDANIIALPARFLEEKEALKCVEAFLNASFEGGRHSDRIKKINEND